VSESEEVLNAELARLLDGSQTAGGTMTAQGEHRTASGKIDVLVQLGVHRIAVEAKKAANLSAAALDRAANAAAIQAEGRVAFKEADFGAVVIYPPDCSASDLSSAPDLRWAASLTDRASASVSFTSLWKGELPGLRDFLSSVPLMGDPEQTAADLERALVLAARRMSAADQTQLIRPFHKVTASGKKGDAEREQACVRVLLMIAAAIMFHAKLQPALSLMDASSIDLDEGAWHPPEPPGLCADRTNRAAAFAEAWRLILEVDYRPIFESAREALVEMLGNAAFNLALKDVSKKALSLAIATHHLRYDLLGSVFHRVLDTARHDGSFYTTAAAATLLTGLAIRDDHVDWADPDAAARLRICDPACGSGTLLLSAVERIERLCADARRERNGDGDDRLLRLAEMIEQSIWGYDINATAIHLAATTLGLAAPDVSFRQMRLFTSQFGRAPDGSIHMGSLDLLTGGAQLQLDTNWGRTQHRQAELDEHQAAAGNLGQVGNKVDVVVMNPPFTRDSLRHDQLGRTDELAVKKAEKELLAKKATAKSKAARLHSSDGMFLLLADYLADAETGTVGLVLPAVVASAAGAQARREFLAGRFAIDFLVTSHDPQRINFSGNTNISEMLVVARRRSDTADPSPPKLVVLLRNPANLVDARFTLDSILQVVTGRAANADDLVIYDMDSARVDAGDWRQAGFVSDWLHGKFLELEAACTTLGAVAPLQVAGRRIRDAYAKAKISSGRRALWDHKSDHVTTMAAKTDCWIAPKASKRHLGDNYWELRSRLLVANRLRLNTMRLAAVVAETKAVGSAFCPAQAKDDTHAKALCVWLNSSLGLLGLYGNRTLKVLSYPRFSMEDLRKLPVPELTDDQACILAAVYDKHAKDKLQPFKTMDSCETRAALDNTVARAVGKGIGFNADQVALVRQGLAQEPSISGRRPD